MIPVLDDNDSGRCKAQPANLKLGPRRIEWIESAFDHLADTAGCRLLNLTRWVSRAENFNEPKPGEIEFFYVVQCRETGDVLGVFRGHGPVTVLNDLACYLLDKVDEQNNTTQEAA